MPPANDHQIAVSDAPFCAETKLPAHSDWQTPVDRFFTRSHFAEPAVDPTSYQLTVKGSVARPFALELDELCSYETSELAVTLECAGNSRSFLTPAAAGLQFEHGATGTAAWTGVPLRILLDRAGVGENAREVLFRGADSGLEGGEHMRFERSLPLQRAMAADTIVAHRMNREPLTRGHGAPARLIVAGWYGMASVKWLTEIEVIDYQFAGHFQSDAYTFINPGRRDGPGDPVTAMAVKSVITNPNQGDTVTAPMTVNGFAWSGHGAIAKVELSFNGGQSWQAAGLAESDNPRAWRAWQLDWSPPGSGHYVIMSRAEDLAGNIQPARAGWNYRGYVNNSTQAIAVTVK